MPAPRKYPDELRERATRMAVEAHRNPAARDGAIARTADRLGINREALRAVGERAMAVLVGRLTVFQPDDSFILHDTTTQAALTRTRTE